MMMHFFNKDLSTLKRPILGLYCVICDPVVVEIAADAGFDFIRIDMEHMTISYDRLADMIRAARLKHLPVQVRISNVSEITKVLNQGADGIVCPNVDNVSIAKEVIKFSKYAPIGMRGIYGLHPNNNYGLKPFDRYLEDANDHVSVTVQIESLQAFENLDHILALDGVDMIATGRGDLSESIGLLGKTTCPEVLRLENKIIEKTLDCKKVPTILVSSKERAHELWEMGVKVMLVGHDLGIFSQSMRESVLSAF